MFQRKLVALLAIVLGISSVAMAQDRATVQMRDGSKFEGRIDEMTAGELFVRVSQNDQRRVAVASVALIDRVGGANGLPATETNEAAGAQHVLLLSNGSSVKGQLLAIRGGEGSANGDQPRAYVFRSADGREQTFPSDQVSRIYLGQYPFAATAAVPQKQETATDLGLATGVATVGSIRVPAGTGWVSTGLRVKKGDLVSFNTSGEVQLSASRADRAKAAGSSRMAQGSPLPTVPAGALIGRVGNGAPFGIGDQSSVPMPFDGVLSLAVNDDERSDNAGEFVVSVVRARR